MAPNRIAQGLFTSPPRGNRTPETMTARWQSMMCGAEKIFYVNITRDDVKTTIAVFVWVIFFLYDLSALFITFSNGNIKFYYRTRIVLLYCRTMLKFLLIFIEFRKKMSLHVITPTKYELYTRFVNFRKCSQLIIRKALSRLDWMSKERFWRDVKWSQN